jgi:hypothetical protein
MRTWRRRSGSGALRWTCAEIDLVFEFPPSLSPTTDAQVQCARAFCMLLSLLGWSARVQRCPVSAVAAFHHPRLADGDNHL